MTGGQLPSHSADVSRLRLFSKMLAKFSHWLISCSRDYRSTRDSFRRSPLSPHPPSLPVKSVHLDKLTATEERSDRSKKRRKSPRGRQRRRRRTEQRSMRRRRRWTCAYALALAGRRERTSSKGKKEKLACWSVGPRRRGAASMGRRHRPPTTSDFQNRP